ncbi:MAG: hypothetical protein H6737_17575 [Alphaproteobacteria bacterium]|nr:hypothetical protein [Alphaproteobacteria bacterium]
MDVLFVVPAVWRGALVYGLFPLQVAASAVAVVAAVLNAVSPEVLCFAVIPSLVSVSALGLALVASPRRLEVHSWGLWIGAHRVPWDAIDTMEPIGEQLRVRAQGREWRIAPRAGGASLFPVLASFNRARSHERAEIPEGDRARMDELLGVETKKKARSHEANGPSSG